VAYLHAYSMFDMNVAGALVRGVSMMYATTVGNDDAIASVMIAPDADHVKISICPGVSRMTWLQRRERPHPRRTRAHALGRARALLDDIQHLVELGREQVERGQDPAVRAEVVSGRAPSTSAPGTRAGRDTHCFITSW
jgi:hypothetical protein